MSEWHLDVSGTPYHVTTERAPNGRIAVRANGRIVAPPQPPEKIDCRFSLGTAQFHLSGAEDALRLDPVIIVAPPPSAQLSELRQPSPSVLDPLQLRSVVFMAIGVILFVLSSCNVVTLRTRISRQEMAAVEDDVEVVNILQMTGSIRFGLMLEVAVAIAFIAGAVMLATKHRRAGIVLESACWAMIAVAVYTFVVLDMLSHRHAMILTNADAARQWLSTFHHTALGILVFLAVASGLLITFLDRQLVELFIEE